MTLAILPMVLLPVSPYEPASGNSPTPALSMTIRITRPGRDVLNQPS
jgi:hypothetical protein